MNYKMKSIIYTHKPPESSPGGEIIFAVQILYKLQLLVKSPFSNIEFRSMKVYL